MIETLLKLGNRAYKAANRTYKEVTYWTSQGLGGPPIKQLSPTIIPEEDPNLPLKRLNSIDHHSNRLVQTSLQLTLLQIDPELDQNPALTQKAFVLQQKLQLHASELMKVGVSDQDTHRLALSGQAAINNIGMAAAMRIINRLGPTRVLDLFNQDVPPSRIAETGLQYIAHADYGPEVVQTFLSQRKNPNQED
jgi:hypothetical protein